MSATQSNSPQKLNFLRTEKHTRTHPITVLYSLHYILTTLHYILTTLLIFQNNENLQMMI